jgi:hypothetical protein
MFLRFPPGSARRFAALLLLLGAMFGASVDAIACEPTSELTTVEAASVNQDGQKQPPGSEQHGDCVHGHCHHGAQQVRPLALEVKLPAAPVKHALPGEHGLASATLDSLKRPPRA